MEGFVWRKALHDNVHLGHKTTLVSDKLTQTKQSFTISGSDVRKMLLSNQRLLGQEPNKVFLSRPRDDC